MVALPLPLSLFLSLSISLRLFLKVCSLVKVIRIRQLMQWLSTERREALLPCQDPLFAYRSFAHYHQLQSTNLWPKFVGRWLPTAPRRRNQSTVVGCGCFDFRCFLLLLLLGGGGGCGAWTSVSACVYVAGAGSSSFVGQFVKRNSKPQIPGNLPTKR